MKRSPRLAFVEQCSYIMGNLRKALTLSCTSFHRQSDGLKLTSSEDKQMLSPDVGKDAARKDEGGDFDLSESKP